MKAYEDYLAKCKEYAENNEEIIKLVNFSDKEIIFPQHILLMKTVSKYLENDKAKTVKIEDEFYFTEYLVNKLMLFAYIKGSRNIEETSFKKGWDACREDVAKKLDFTIED